MSKKMADYVVDALGDYLTENGYEALIIGSGEIEPEHGELDLSRFQVTFKFVGSKVENNER